MSPRRVTIPIAFPPAGHCDIPTRPDPLPADSPERARIQPLLDHFADERLEIPVKEGSDEVTPIDDWEKMFLSEEMMGRYLNATKDKTQEAIKRLQSTLVWRRTQGLYDVEACLEEVKPEFDSGKIAITGYTKQAQPILWTWTSKNVQPPSARAVKHVMFCMERVIDLQLAGVRGIMFCADISGKTQTSSGALGVTRSILNNLQAHYPERLGGAAVVGMPWLGSIFVTLMWPFIDPLTRNKIFINPDLSDNQLVADDQLLDVYGGDLQWEYTDEYLPVLAKLCLERRAANLRRWKEAGGQVGLSEWDFLESAPTDTSEETTTTAFAFEPIVEAEKHLTRETSTTAVPPTAA